MFAAGPGSSGLSGSGRLPARAATRRDWSEKSKTHTLAAVRLSTVQDSLAISNLHRDAWQNAYRGIIPGIALERMIARRGPAWWRRMHEAGGCVLVVDWDDEPVGYAMFGRARVAARGLGELYELYLRPECQGTGLGRPLFEAFATAPSRGGHSRLVVWALRENTTACRFYRAMHGIQFARSCDRIGGVRLEKIGFTWP